MEHERADARFRFHHETFGEVDADFFGSEEREDASLVFERRAGGVAEAVTFAAVAGLKPVEHRRFGGIGETPVFPETAMQPFGSGFGGFQGERLQRVRLQKLAPVLELIGAFEDAGAGSDDEGRDRVAARYDVVSEAETVGRALAVEGEDVERRSSGVILSEAKDLRISM